MRSDELKSGLGNLYTDDAKFGVERAPNAGYENIWFAVPPTPPISMPAGVMSKANTLLQRRPRFSASSLDKLAAYLFARREVVPSSRMEGAWFTIDDVLTPQNAATEGDEKSDALSVHGYSESIRSNTW